MKSLSVPKAPWGKIVLGKYGEYDEESDRTKRCWVSSVGKNIKLLTSGGSGTTVQWVPEKQIIFYRL